MTSFQILVAGVLVIHPLQRVTRWMHGRGWIHWKLRGTSSALGNAVLSVQVLFEPQVREVVEARMEEEGVVPSTAWLDDSTRSG